MLQNDKISYTADRTRRTLVKSSGTAGESDILVECRKKAEDLVYTEKRRSFKVTQIKREDLRERLVEMRGTSERRGGSEKEDNYSENLLEKE